MIYFNYLKYNMCQLNLNFVGHFLNILQHLGLKFPNFVLSKIS